MTPSGIQQRNRYKGSPLRPWVRLRILGATGSVEEVQLVVDTESRVATVPEDI